MLPQPPRRLSRLGPFLVLTSLTVIALASGCDKVPLLAPSGSVITIFPAANSVPVNGSIEIVATVIEQGTAAPPPTNPPPTNPPTTPTTPGQTPTTPTGTTSTATTGAGTPVQNGTVVTFTTTIGRIEPNEARTQNGQVRVRFIATNQSGTATITAFSGGASGRLENLRVGTAAAERVLVTASPQALGCSGGTSEIAARVEDAAGAGVAGIPVTFSTTQGQLQPATATTDADGVARTQLNATREATVTANVAGRTATVAVTVSARTGIGITPPTTAVAAGVPAAFTINVSSTANLNNVTVDFGDGERQQLGAISGATPVSHTFDEAGTYVVRATASDASGCTESVASSITILPAQPPSVTLTVSDQNPEVGETVIITATVSGNTSTIQRYEWNFGSGAVPATASTTGNRVSVTWSTPGTKIITVTVTQANGPSGDGQTAVVVSQ